MSKKNYGPCLPPIDNDNDEIVGPLLPHEEIKRVPCNDASSSNKGIQNNWLGNLLKSSNEPNPSANLKARNFSMKSGGYDPELYEIAKPSLEPSLMQLHNEKLRKKEKKEMKKRKKEKKKKKKHKRKRSSSSSCSSEKKAKKTKLVSQLPGFDFKWNPYNANTDRKSFDRDSEIGSGSKLSNNDKSKFYSNIQTLSSQFVTNKKS